MPLNDSSFSRVFTQRQRATGKGTTKPYVHIRSVQIDENGANVGCITFEGQTGVVGGSCRRSSVEKLDPEFVKEGQDG